MDMDRVIEWVGGLDQYDLNRLESAISRRLVELCRCEHGVPDGLYCEPCNREYKRTRREHHGEDPA